jgi:hypothetical protein
MVSTRQTDKSLEALPLHVRYDNCVGGDTPCPVCDPYFDTLGRTIPWEEVPQPGPDLYRRMCGYVCVEKVRLKT